MIFVVQRRIFASGGTEAFLEGHVHAFTALGGVPTGKIRYDNLRAAHRLPGPDDR
jgi:hypothetical protein